MAARDRKTIEAEEFAFFDQHYAQQGSGENPIGWRLRMERELRSLQRVLGGKRPRRALSIGCGDGQFELMLSRYVDSLTALDISKAAIETARTKAREAGVTNVDFRCLPLGDLAWDDSYDCIVCLAFLHHVPEGDLAEFLAEAHRHLTPGGLFYSQDPNVKGALRKIGRVVMGDRYDRYHSPDERELDPDDVLDKLRAAGFPAPKVEYIDVTLIPASIIMSKMPGWPLHLAAAFDRAFVKTPLASLGSGFVAFGRRSAASS
jgi:SAM-dependent methyltransferase